MFPFGAEIGGPRGLALFFKAIRVQPDVSATLTSPAVRRPAPSGISIDFDRYINLLDGNGFWV
jgi:hypothetical protein